MPWSAKRVEELAHHGRWNDRLFLTNLGLHYVKLNFLHSLNQPFPHFIHILVHKRSQINKGIEVSKEHMGVRLHEARD